MKKTLSEMINIMDRFSEQLVERTGDKKTAFLKGLIVAVALLVIAFVVMLALWSGLTLAPLCLAIVIGAVWLAVYLCQGLDVEYEYIVTNDDLDIDKIMGKRKRKRLMSVDLKSVDEFYPYLNNTELHSDVTVLADDGTGYDMWYVFIDTEGNGKIAIIFNPDERTIENITGGLNPQVRAKVTARLKEMAEIEKTT